MRALPLVLVALGLAGCPEAAALVRFEVGVDPEEDPIGGATDVLIEVRADGVTQPGLSQSASLSAPVRTPIVPFGDTYSIRVSVLDQEIVLARGTSVRFDVDADATPALPDVFVAPLGRFARVAARAGALPVAGVARGDTILLGLESGAASAYSLDALTEAEVLSDAPGARFIALDAGILRVVGTHADFVDGNVQVRSGALPHEADPTAVVAAHANCAYFVGGVTDDRATRVCQEDGAITATSLPSTSVRGAGGTAVIVEVRERPILVWSGRSVDGVTSSDTAFVDLLDPTRSVVAALGLPATGATLVRSGPDEFTSVGGADSGGTRSAEVARVVVTLDPGTPAVRVTPASEPLFVARTDARATELAPSVFLVYGGTDATGAIARRPEIVDLRNVRGVVAPTGALPAATPSLIVPIDDAAQILFSSDGVHRYATPRGTEP